MKIVRLKNQSFDDKSINDYLANEDIVNVDIITNTTRENLLENQTAFAKVANLIGSSFKSIPLPDPEVMGLTEQQLEAVIDVISYMNIRDSYYSIETGTLVNIGYISATPETINKLNHDLEEAFGVPWDIPTNISPFLIITDLAGIYLPHILTTYSENNHYKITNFSIINNDPIISIMASDIEKASGTLLDYNDILLIMESELDEISPAILPPLDISRLNPKRIYSKIFYVESKDLIIVPVTMITENNSLSNHILISEDKGDTWERIYTNRTYKIEEILWIEEVEKYIATTHNKGILWSTNLKDWNTIIEESIPVYSSSILPAVEMERIAVTFGDGTVYHINFKENPDLNNWTVIQIPIKTDSRFVTTWVPDYSSAFGIDINGNIKVSTIDFNSWNDIQVFEPDPTLVPTSIKYNPNYGGILSTFESRELQQSSGIDRKFLMSMENPIQDVINIRDALEIDPIGTGYTLELDPEEDNPESRNTFFRGSTYLEAIATPFPYYGNEDTIIEWETLTPELLIFKNKHIPVILWPNKVETLKVEFNSTVRKGYAYSTKFHSMEIVPTDEVYVAVDILNLSKDNILFEQSDNGIEPINYNFTLPTKGLNYTDITWSWKYDSDKIRPQDLSIITAYVDIIDILDDGYVIVNGAPPSTHWDYHIILTATITKGDHTKTKEFRFDIGKIPVTKIEIYRDSSFQHKEEGSIQITQIGHVYTLYAKIIPEDATDNIVTWTIDNDQVISIDPTDNQVVLEALTLGKTSIRATIGNTSAMLLVDAGTPIDNIFIQGYEDYEEGDYIDILTTNRVLEVQATPPSASIKTADWSIPNTQVVNLRSPSGGEWVSEGTLSSQQTTVRLDYIATGYTNLTIYSNDPTYTQSKMYTIRSGTPITNIEVEIVGSSTIKHMYESTELRVRTYPGNNTSDGVTIEIDNPEYAELESVEYITSTHHYKEYKLKVKAKGPDISDSENVTITVKPRDINTEVYAEETITIEPYELWDIGPEGGEILHDMGSYGYHHNKYDIKYTIKLDKWATDKSLYEAYMYIYLKGYWRYIEYHGSATAKLQIAIIATARSAIGYYKRAISSYGTIVSTSTWNFYKRWCQRNTHEQNLIDYDCPRFPTLEESYLLPFRDILYEMCGNRGWWTCDYRSLGNNRDFYGRGQLKTHTGSWVYAWENTKRRRPVIKRV